MIRRFRRKGKPARGGRGGEREAVTVCLSGFSVGRRPRASPSFSSVRCLHSSGSALPSRNSFCPFNVSLPSFALLGSSAHTESHHPSPPTDCPVLSARKSGLSSLSAVEKSAFFARGLRAALLRKDCFSSGRERRFRISKRSSLRTTSEEERGVQPSALQPHNAAMWKRKRKRVPVSTARPSTLFSSSSSSPNRLPFFPFSSFPCCCSCSPFSSFSLFPLSSSSFPLHSPCSFSSSSPSISCREHHPPFSCLSSSPPPSRSSFSSSFSSSSSSLSPRPSSSSSLSYPVHSFPSPFSAASSFFSSFSSSSFSSSSSSASLTSGPLTDRVALSSDLHLSSLKPSSSSSLSSPFSSLCFQTRGLTVSSRHRRTSQSGRRKRRRRKAKTREVRESRPSKRKQVEIERKVKNPFEFEKKRDGVELIQKGDIFSPEGCNSRKLAVLLCALQKFGYARDRGLLLRYAEQAYSICASIYPRHGSLILNVLARNHVMHADLLETLGNHFCAKLRNTNGQDLALIANAYARLSFFHPRLFKRLSEEIPHKLTHFEPQHVVSVTHAFVKLNIADSLFFDDVAEQVVRDLPSFSPRCTALMANLLGSRVRYQNDFFWKRFLSHAWRLREELCVSEVVMIGHGLSAVFYTGEKRLGRGARGGGRREANNGERGTEALSESISEEERMEEFFRFMIQKVSKDFTKISIPEIAQVFNACSRTGIYDPYLFECLYTRFQQSPKLLTEEAGVSFISQILHACGTLRPLIEDSSLNQKSHSYRNELVDLLASRLYLIALENVFDQHHDRRSVCKSLASRIREPSGRESEDREQKQDRKEENEVAGCRHENADGKSFPGVLTPQAIAVSLRALQRLGWGGRAGGGDDVRASSPSDKDTTETCASRSSPTSLGSSSTSGGDASDAASLSARSSSFFLSSEKTSVSSLSASSPDPADSFKSSSSSAPSPSSAYSVLGSSSPSLLPPQQRDRQRGLVTPNPLHLPAAVDLVEVQEKLVPLLCSCLSMQLSCFTPQGLCESVDSISALGVQNDFLFYQISTEIRSKRIWPYLTPQGLLTILRAFSRHHRQVAVSREPRRDTTATTTAVVTNSYTSHSIASIPPIVMKCLDRLRHSTSRMSREECLIAHRGIHHIEEHLLEEASLLRPTTAGTSEKENGDHKERDVRVQGDGNSTPSASGSTEIMHAEASQKVEVQLKLVSKKDEEDKPPSGPVARASSLTHQTERRQQEDSVGTLKKNKDEQDVKQLISLLKKGLDKRLMKLEDIAGPINGCVDLHGESVTSGCEDTGRDRSGSGTDSRGEKTAHHIGRPGEARERGRRPKVEMREEHGASTTGSVSTSTAGERLAHSHYSRISHTARHGVKKAMAAGLAAEEAEREAVRFFSEHADGNWRLRHVETRKETVPGSQKEQEKAHDADILTDERWTPSRGRMDPSGYFRDDDAKRTDQNRRLLSRDGGKTEEDGLAEGGCDRRLSGRGDEEKQGVCEKTYGNGKTAHTGKGEEGILWDEGHGDPYIGNQEQTPLAGESGTTGRRRGRRARRASSSRNVCDPSSDFQTETIARRTVVDGEKGLLVSSVPTERTSGSFRRREENKRYDKSRQKGVIEGDCDVDPARYAKLLFEDNHDSEGKRDHVFGDSLDELFSRLHSQQDESHAGAGTLRSKGAWLSRVEDAEPCKRETGTRRERPSTLPADDAELSRRKKKGR